MVVALNPSSVYEYVPVADRDAEKPSTFVLRPMTTVDRVELSSIASGEDNPGAKGGALAIAVLRRCLVSWRGVVDASGAEVPLVRDWAGVTRDCLARLPAAVLFELANEVFTREAVTAADVGKS